MKDLIAIQDQGGKPAVNARDLHKFLEVGKDFSTWIKDRIGQYGFVSGQDYCTESRSPELGTGNRGASIEYFLTLDMAKELSMVENNDRGREARRYFISVEKKARLIAPAIGRIISGPLTGPKLRELRLMAQDKTLTPAQVQELLGVRHLHREGEVRVEQERQEIYVPPQIGASILSNIKNKLASANAAVTHKMIDRAIAKETQDRLNRKLDFNGGEA